MKTEDILSIEESGENRINLVRDRLFWQAWNRSAFLFVSHIKKYQVHKRFIQKVSQDVAWLGFPKTAMDAIEKAAKDKGWSFERISADHITIGGVPQTNGYEKWWAGIVKPPKIIVAPAEPKAKSGKERDGRPQILPAYKTAYDLCLHVYRATAKMPKEFKYELGARVRNYATDIAEELHLMSRSAAGVRGGGSADSLTGCAGLIHRLRIDVRILHDLRLIGVNQWGFLNQQIESLLESLRAEFRNINAGFTGEAFCQSDAALPPALKGAGGRERLL